MGGGEVSGRGIRTGAKGPGRRARKKARNPKSYDGISKGRMACESKEKIDQKDGSSNLQLVARKIIVILNLWEVYLSTPHGGSKKDIIHRGVLRLGRTWMGHRGILARSLFRRTFQELRQQAGLRCSEPGSRETEEAANVSFVQCAGRGTSK